jgi:hypothetical protein
MSPIEIALSMIEQNPTLLNERGFAALKQLSEPATHVAPRVQRRAQLVYLGIACNELVSAIHAA